MENNKPDGEETPILSVIQKIRDGSLDPRALSKETRQQCIEVMNDEGYPEATIAQILNRSERTIRRDLRDIKRRHSVSPDINFAKELVGEMIQKARAHSNALIRIARSRETSDADKIAAEVSAWRIERELIEKLQSLGYMPLRPQELVMTSENQEVTFADMEKRLLETQSVARERGIINPQQEAVFQALQAEIEKAKLNQKISDFADEQKQPEKQGD